MASESPIAIQLQTALAQHLKRAAASIRPGDRLREDLGLDSLAMIELLFKIEEHFDLEIPNEDLSRITTIADVTAYVEDKLRRRGDGGSEATPTPSAPGSSAAVAPAVKAGTGRPAAKSTRRGPAVVTSIKAAKRKAAGTATKPGPAKKKGSRRA
jgi:acyl carrier protein